MGKSVFRPTKSSQVQPTVALHVLPPAKARLRVEAFSMARRQESVTAATECMKRIPGFRRKRTRCIIWIQVQLFFSS